MCLSCFFSIRTKDQWALHLHSSFCFWFAPHNMTKYLLSTFLCPAAMRNWECSHVQYWNKNKEAVRVCKFKDRLVTQNWTLLRLTAKSTSLKAIMQVNWKPKLQKWTGSRRIWKLLTPLKSFIFLLSISQNFRLLSQNWLESYLEILP